MGLIDITSHFIVRAGLARPDSLIIGTTPHRDIAGLTGFSVQSAPGVAVEELARGGLFPHGWISVTTLAVVQWYGFKLIFPTQGRGVYHATIEVPCPLPRDLASLLASLFIQRRNPHPVR